MIKRGTLVGLLEHDHKLAAYCPQRDVWRVLPVAELAQRNDPVARVWHA